MTRASDQSDAPEARSADQNLVSPVSSERLVTQDPVFRLLHDKIGCKWSIILIVLLLSIVYFCESALLFKSPSTASSTSASLELLTALRKILTTSLGLFVYLRLPGWIAGLFNSLKHEDVIGESRDKILRYEDFLAKVVRKVDRKVWAVCGLVFIIAFWAWRIFSYYRHSAYSSKRPFWLEAAALIVYGIPYYAFIVALIKFCVILFLTTRLFSLFNIQVNPLHPDGAGGFGAIGRLLSRFVMATVAFALLASAGRFLSYARYGYLHMGRTEVILLLMTGTVLPLFLWAWLWVPHKAMVKFRDRKLMILAEEFRRSIRDGHLATPADSVSIKLSTDRLAELKKSYELLKETYPVWPMSFGRMRSLVALTSAPLITTFFPQLIDYLRGR